MQKENKGGMYPKKNMILRTDVFVRKLEKKVLWRAENLSCGVFCSCDMRPM